jgi:hypothetical protein
MPQQSNRLPPLGRIQLRHCRIRHGVAPHDDSLGPSPVYEGREKTAQALHLAARIAMGISAPRYTSIELVCRPSADFLGAGSARFENMGDRRPQSRCRSTQSRQRSTARQDHSSASNDQFIRTRLPRRGIRPSGKCSVTLTHFVKHADTWFFGQRYSVANWTKLTRLRPVEAVRRRIYLCRATPLRHRCCPRSHRFGSLSDQQSGHT